MRGGTESGGYTILEVMIFMAISGLMFVMAAVMLSGKQANAEFHQGMNAANSQIQSIVNDVINGSFDSPGNFQCVADASTNDAPHKPTPSGTAEQGSNQGCIFAGKVVESWYADDTPSQNYTIYTLAGRQYQKMATDNQVAETFDQVMPTIFDELSENGQWQWDLQVKKIVSGTSHDQIYGIGFFNSFGTDTASDGLASGSQNIIVVPIVHANDSAQIESELAGITTPPAALPNPDITICFDGGKGRVGTLTIGGDVGSTSYGQRIATSIHTLNTLPDYCT